MEVFRRTAVTNNKTMYIPKINLATDREEIVAFMKQFSFATIITAKENLPVATHLPFLVTTHEIANTNRQE